MTMLLMIILIAMRMNKLITLILIISIEIMRLTWHAITSMLFMRIISDITKADALGHDDDNGDGGCLL